MENIPKAGDTLFCNCGEEIGKLVNVNGELWISAGSRELSIAHGRCGKCKKLWHFNSNDYRLQRLLKRARMRTIK